MHEPKGKKRSFQIFQEMLHTRYSTIKQRKKKEEENRTNDLVEGIALPIRFFFMLHQSECVAYVLVYMYFISLLGVFGFLFHLLFFTTGRNVFRLKN